MAMADDETIELYAKALSYDHVIAELAANAKEKPRHALLGLDYDMEPMSKDEIPIIVKLPTMRPEKSPCYFHPWYLKVEWENVPTKVTDDIIIPDLDVLNEKEDGLALELENCCDAFGKEADDKLIKTGNIMVAMGKLYLVRAVSCGALVSILTYVKNAGIFGILVDKYNRACDLPYDPESYDITKELAEEAGARLPEDGVNLFSTTLKRIIESCCQQITLKGIPDGMIMLSANYFFDEVVAHYKVEQKLTLIRAAGLVMAGKVRFIKMQDEVMVKHAESLYYSVLDEIVNSAGSKELVENWPRFDITLALKRAVRANELEDVVDVENSDPPAVQLEKEMKKISQIRKLCERNVEDFIEFMREISSKCQQILGKPPCNFAIVGLGSLARSEVTLYSDFEHAIALQNDAEDCEDWPLTLEYFRWYTVLFHAIVIGLGETVLPGLHIRGLRAEGSGKYWFYDAFTPNGISFDGMMPHACKIPLGRTGKTKFKDHTVELIQTARKMAQFLTRDEDIKNGYFLKEVLSKTCFVDGDIAVYESFLEECRCVSSREEPDNLATRIAKYLLLNPLTTVSGSHMPLHAREETNKSLTYRPFTLYLGYFAKLCGIEFKSSFDILDEMKKMEVLGEETYHTLASALAVTMEISFKAYHEARNQWKTFVPFELASFVGERSWIDCQVVLEVLRDSVKLLPPTRCRKITIPSRQSTLWKILSCFHLTTLGYYQDATKQALHYLLSTLEKYTSRVIHTGNARAIVGELLGCLRHCFLRIYMHRFADIPGAEVLLFRRSIPEGEFNELYPCEWASQKVIQIEIDAELPMWAYQSLCVIRFNQGRYEEGLECFERWEKLISGREQDQVDMWMYEMLMKIEVMGYENVQSYINDKFREDIPFERACVLTIIRCKIWLKVESLENAKAALMKINFMVQSHSRKMSQYSCEYLLKIIREIYVENGFQDEVGVSNFLLKSAMSKNILKLSSDYSRMMEISAIEEEVATRAKKYQLTHLIHLSSEYGAVKLMYKLCNVLAIAFTREELIDVVEGLLYHSKRANDMPGRFAPHAFAVIALFEGANDQVDVQKALQIYREAPRGVRAYRVLQPFLFGFMKSALIGNERNTLHRHVKIFKAIFGHPPKQPKHELYNAAMSAFIRLRFVDSLKLLWKLCQAPGIAEDAKKGSFGLFVTVMLTILVQKKRQNSYSYFSKMRELSTKQWQWVRAIQTKTRKDFSMRNIERVNLHIFRNLRLVRVYNFAINGHDLHPGRVCFFYWRILHHPTESKAVKRAALLAFCDAVATSDRFSRRPIMFW